MDWPTRLGESGIAGILWACGCESQMESTSRLCRSFEASDVEQRLVEVGDDVFDVFNANGKAYKTFGDADAIADVGGHGGVGHRSWKRDESFDSAEAFGERAKFYLIEEAARCVERFEVEREHCARAAILFAGELVLRVGVQAGVEDFFHFWMRVEMTGHGDAIGVVLQHADGERFDTTRN